MVFQVKALRQDWQEKDRDDPYVWKAPQLLVECLSPANRKGSAQKLLDDYATIKAPEVWAALSEASAAEGIRLPRRDIA